VLGHEQKVIERVKSIITGEKSGLRLEVRLATTLKSASVREILLELNVDQSRSSSAGSDMRATTPRVFYAFMEVHRTNNIAVL